ncbi:Kinetochore protein Nuf2 [Rhynchospora pubera]|uniref:Kinetochore protein Nuf2 n=1 Tax=Rhynchospora pubera TaxID=906938 RepID=A0AAV8GBI4_9POAL|nr:Kinetochore protein Nuf2 [Rhynchospora pubera]
MANFSFPELSAAEIAGALQEEGIANVSAADLAKPSPELLFAIFSNLFAYFDPFRNDPDSQIGFEALTVLEDPSQHADSIRVLNLYQKIKEFFASIQYHGFELRDLLRPDPKPKPTLQHLSAVVNFIYYRNEKLQLLKPILDEVPSSEDRKIELTSRISELQTAIQDHEMEARMEEPVILQLGAEVRDLEQTIQNYNKQQMSLKTHAKELKEMIDAINNQISQADFKLMNEAQEISKLSAQVVQSPDKLQMALEEKKSAKADAKNLEKLTTQKVLEKIAALELYTKAHEKLCKHLEKMQALQEQVNKNKALEKEVKTLKVKLSDENVSVMTLEAKLMEKQGKVQQAEEMLKMAEKERDETLIEENKKLNDLKSQYEQKLKLLVLIEKEAEAMVSVGGRLLQEAESVRQSGIAMQQQLLTKGEKIVQAFDYNDKNDIDRFVQKVDELEKISFSS